VSEAGLTVQSTLPVDHFNNFTSVMPMPHSKFNPGSPPIFLARLLHTKFTYNLQYQKNSILSLQSSRNIPEDVQGIMSRAKKTRKFATVKRMIQQRDSRLKKNILKDDAKEKLKDEVIREM
jgi:hypothetical protein